MAVVLARNWWLLALRGAAAVVFGLLTLFNPLASLAVLVIFFGAFALADGIFAVAAGATAPAGNRRWGWLIAGGIVSALIGILALVAPQTTTLALTFYIAAWAVIVGITQIIAAIRLRKEIAGEFWLILGGALSVLFGLFAFINPLGGALTITFIIGFYALIFGVSMLILAFRLRSWRRGQTV